MPSRVASTTFTITPLIGLIIIAVAAIWLPTALSAGNLAWLSAAETGTDRTVWLPAASHIDFSGGCCRSGDCFSRPLPKDRQRQDFEPFFSATGEVPVFWRLHKRRYMFWGQLCPVMTTSSTMDLFYCPGWYDPPLILLFTEEPSSKLVFDLTILRVRPHGEIIGSYSAYNLGYSRFRRESARSWVSANHSGLMRLWLLESLATVQKDGRHPLGFGVQDAFPARSRYDFDRAPAEH